ncbi:MAG: carboxypeptidase-like regulatory domain-containing protein, partial [Chitinophagaceae bacterium]
MMPCISQVAQSVPGLIKGYVIDGSNNKFLFGVSVKKDNTQKSTTTNADGSYQFQFDRGDHNLIFSLAGFQTKKIDKIPVSDGSVTYLTIILYPRSQGNKFSEKNTSFIDSVSRNDSLHIIEFSKETKQPSYNPVRQYPNLSDILIKREIGTATDRDASMLLKRLNGVLLAEVPANNQLQSLLISGMGERHNQLLINNMPFVSSTKNSRTFPLSLIPVEMIESVSLEENANAALPADYSGGTINLKFKEIPEYNKFYLQLGSGFYSTSKSNTFKGDPFSTPEKLSLPTLSRQLPANFPGTRTQFSLSDKNPQEQVELLRLLPNNLSPKTTSAIPPYSRVIAGWEKLFTLKKGVSIGIVSYLQYQNIQNNEETIVQVAPNVTENPFPFNNADKPVINAYSNNIEYHHTSQLAAFINGTILFRRNKISIKTILSNHFIDSYTENNYIYKPDEDTLANKGIKYKIEQRRIANLSLTGEHAFGTNGKFKLEWFGSFLSYDQNNPDERNFLLRQSGININNFEIATPITSPLPNRSAVGGAALDANLAAIFTNSGRSWTRQKDKLFTGSFNLSFPFTLLRRPQTLAGGIFVQSAYRELYSDLLLYQGTGYVPLEGLIAQARYFPGGLKVEEFYNGIVDPNGNFSIRDIRADDLGNYTGSSTNGSSYVQWTSRLSKIISFQTGLRVESSSQLISSTEYYYLEGFKNAKRIPLNENTNITQYNILPSFILRFNPIRTLEINASYFKTLNRPQMEELSAHRSYDAGNFMTTNGNILLQNSTINNFRGGIHWFPSSTSLIRFTGNYKKIFLPIEYLVTRYASSRGNLSRTPFNMPTAELYSIQASFKT